ncbi:MAG: PPOX class F420-dependent oxidoreductase [Streptosporangiaceae bacterium]
MTVKLSSSARTLVSGRNPGILGTVNPDGSPQTSVIWVGEDGDDLVMSSAAGRRKVLNLDRDPRASLTIVDPVDIERYIEIRGTATVTEDPGRSLAVALGEKYDGPGGGQAFLDLPPEVVRVVIRLTPLKVVGSAAG